VVAIHTTSLLPWVASHRHGLSLPKLRWVARSSLQEAVTSSSFEIETGAAVAAPDRAQVLDMSIPERLRRLAGRYVNDAESIVNGVHLEPGPSGRFQIVITIEIGDILGDTS